MRAEGLSVGHGDATVVAGVDVSFDPGTFTAVVGPNGCGKSTLVRTLAGLQSPRAGRVTLGGADVAEIRPRAMARSVAFLPQTPLVPTGVSVRQLVGYGRHPHQRLLGGTRASDDAAVDAALEATGLGALAERDVAHLSGGERQRAWVAMALAQETDVVLLDEPTTYLDIRYQLDVMRLLRSVVDERGLTVVAVLHDLNQAAEFADRVLLLAAGAVVASSTPADVLTEDHIGAAFGVEVHVRLDDVTGVPHCRFPGRTAVATVEATTAAHDRSAQDDSAHDRSAHDNEVLR